MTVESSDAGSSTRLTVALWIAAIAAIGLPFLFWAIYGGSAVWPGLAANFTASFFAFVLALRWDRHARQEERRAEEATFQERTSAEREDRDKEARGRLALILEEIQANRTIFATNSFKEASSAGTMSSSSCASDHGRPPERYSRRSPPTTN